MAATTAADDILIYLFIYLSTVFFFFFLFFFFFVLFFCFVLLLLFLFLFKKIRLDISCELSAWQTIHMKCQDLFSNKKINIL